MLNQADKTFYRADLDGLRSLAILPVVFYHYGVPGLGGGFVGVDIFFVLSGFLITSVLLRDLESQRFSLTLFYERRARRILPALFFMLAVTTALAALVMLPRDLSHFGKTLVGTTGFASNLFFWREFGYFDRAAEMKPLLHTWSLAVEEQFYIFFPLVLWLVARFARNYLTPVLIVIACGSFALAIAGASRAPVAAFYLPITRAWELLIGSILAANAMPATTNVRLRDILSLTGLALVIGSVLLIERTLAFPGWRALMPCVGAGLLIYTGWSGDAIANRALRWKPLVGIGLISYSLYLWHWPLLVLAKYAANRELSAFELAVVLAVASGLSLLSWRYIERPFRGTASVFDRPAVFRLSGLATAAAALCGVAIVNASGFPSRVPANVLKYANVSSEEAQVSPGCFGRRSEDVRAGRLCRVGAADTDVAPSFIVWGDSHAFRAAMPIAEIAAARRRAGWLASSGFCPPLLDVEWPTEDCGAFNQAVVNLIEQQHISTVVISGIWAYYAEGTKFDRTVAEGVASVLSDNSSTTPNADGNGEVFGRALRRTVERLTHAGAHVVIIGPVPEIKAAVPESLALAEWHGGSKTIGPSQAEFDYRQRDVLPAIQTAAMVDNAESVYPSSVLCAGVCAVEQNGNSLYIDDNHLSQAGLDLIKPVLARILN